MEGFCNRAKNNKLNIAGTGRQTMKIDENSLSADYEVDIETDKLLVIMRDIVQSNKH